MTKLLTLVTVLILGSLSLFAQDAPATEPSAAPLPPAEPAQPEPAQPEPIEKDEPAGGPSFGIKGWVGASLPTFSGLPAGVTTESDIAWAAGVFFNWSTKGIISLGIQPELMYVSETGVKTNVPVDGQPTTSNITTTVNSLRLPVLAKLQFLDPLLVQPSVYIGPSFSYAVSATNKSGDVSNDIETGFQVGLAAGIDVTVLNFLVADLRINTKFTPLTYDIANVAQNIELTMASVKFGLGLRF